jgi:hypothetical protein
LFFLSACPIIILTMTWQLIYLAVSSGFFGLVITYLILYAINHFGIDISKNWWIVAVPVILAIVLNVCLIEIYRKFWRRQK